MTQEAAPADYVLRKNGYFYRPNSQGYTASIFEAGRYTFDDAVAHALSCSEVKVHHASEFASAPLSAYQRPEGDHGK